MKLLVYAVLIFSISVMIFSFLKLFRFNIEEFNVFSWNHFLLLVWVYLILTVGFSLVYLSLDFLELPNLKVHDETIIPGTFAYIGNLIYFSLVTMLTVGYGDITPIGIGKFIASIQALIGYLLPAAFLASGIAKARMMGDRG